MPLFSLICFRVQPSRLRTPRNNAPKVGTSEAIYADSFPVDEFSNQDNSVPIRTRAPNAMGWRWPGQPRRLGEEETVRKWQGFAFGLAAIAAGTALAQQAVKLGPDTSVGKPSLSVAAPGATPATLPAGGDELNKNDVDAWLRGYMAH